MNEKEKKRKKVEWKMDHFVIINTYTASGKLAFQEKRKSRLCPKYNF